MFPGQGAQFVGMCEDTCKTVPAAKVSCIDHHNIM